MLNLGNSSKTGNEHNQRLVEPSPNSNQQLYWGFKSDDSESD